MTFFDGPVGETAGRAPPTDIEVLVIGNDETARSRIATLVGTFGVSVRGAADLHQTHHLVRERRPDLILCVLETPGLDVFGFIRRLRREPRFRRILVVAVSGPGQPLDVHRARAAGFAGHVVEPITALALARLLDRVLDRRNAEDR